MKAIFNIAGDFPDRLMGLTPQVLQFVFQFFLLIFAGLNIPDIIQVIDNDAPSPVEKTE